MTHNSVELLEHAIQYAKNQGIRIRTESLDGTGSGLCRIGGKPVLFLEQAATADQQFVEIMKILRVEQSPANRRAS